MADIAFLLLIFFLVATTMNVDTGITRQLPPIPPKEVKNDLKVKERNLLTVYINQYDEILVAGQRAHISQLTDIAKMFFVNAKDDPNMPSKKAVEIELPDGGKWNYMVSEGVVSLNSSRATSYDIYIQVQNELTRALNELRDDLSKAKFGNAFLQLSEGEQEAIRKAIPPNISESEPRTEAGGK